MGGFLAALFQGQCPGRDIFQVEQAHIVKNLQADFSPGRAGVVSPHPSVFLVHIPVEKVFHQVQGGQMAVFVVDKLAQALLEKGEDSGVLPGQLGNLVVQIEVGKGEGAGLGITVLPGPVPAVGIGPADSGRAKEFHRDTSLEKIDCGSKYTLFFSKSKEKIKRMEKKGKVPWGLHGTFFPIRRRRALFARGSPPEPAGSQSPPEWPGGPRPQSPPGR